MTDQTKIAVAALVLAGFGFFLIWKGITGDVVKTNGGQSFMPRWMYILSGLGMLILPVAYFILMVFIIE